MLESIILGAIQGIAEWLPISSEGLIVFAASSFGSMTLPDLLRLALFLHLGTTLAAIVYFWNEVAGIIRTLFAYKKAPAREQAFLRFLIVATLISGILGLALFGFIEATVGALSVSGKAITALVAMLLIFTGIIQLRKKAGGTREVADLNIKDGILLGLAQGIAALPGVSRSGITVASLLLRQVREEKALAVSFIMGIPLILAGNLILNAAFFTPSIQGFTGLLTAFVFGFATIHAALAIARKINFGWFVIGFAVLMLTSLFL